MMKSRLPALAIALLLLAAGAFLLYARLRTPASPAAVVPLPEVDRTNLSRIADRLHRSGDTNPFTGFLVDRYTDGSLRSRSEVSNGLLHGVSEGWHTNGVLQIRESFLAGVSHGTRTKWNADGSRLSEASIENGRLHGTFRRWHTNGILAEEIPMKADQPDGVSRAFHPSGSLKTRILSRDGQVIEREAWEDGRAPADTAAPAPAPAPTATPH